MDAVVFFLLGTEFSLQGAEEDQGLVSEDLTPLWVVQNKYDIAVFTVIH